MTPSGSPLDHNSQPTPPSPTTLRTSGFGQISPNHSFTQEACFETVLIHIFKSGMLHSNDLHHLLRVHPLFQHLYHMTTRLQNYNFASIAEYNHNWASQESIPFSRKMSFLACLLHYDLRVSEVMRFAGNNYTGAYRHPHDRLRKIEGLVNNDLLAHYIRIMHTGAPAIFNASTSRDNALLHWRMGNHPSINQKRLQVMATMNKEERNCYVIPLPSWIARFCPNMFFTPQHILEKPGRKDRQIFDASRRFTPTSVPLNMMTSTAQSTITGDELQCLFGDSFTKILVRIWNLRISYPYHDIVLHASDVKSCFRQLKHHPDVVGAFSYIIADILYVPCGLTFGSDFSPATWEVCRRMAEQMSEKLFDDDSLVEKHRHYLDQLIWGDSLGNPKRLTQARACRMHQGVLDSSGRPVNTPHTFYVDDGIYCEVHDRTRVRRAAAASIEAIFRLLGESALTQRQDPISWEKLLEMIINFINIILGHSVNTRTMLVSTPDKYLSQIIDLLSHWHSHRKSFTLLEIETLVGKLNQIATSTPWLRHLMSHLYLSIGAALRDSRAYLLTNSAAFRNLLKLIKHSPATALEARVSSFSQAASASAVHRTRRQFFINKTMRDELRLIRLALTSPNLRKSTPIAHLIPRTPDAAAWGDSSLDAAGGFSTDMQFWWYLEWPQAIRERTLRNISDGRNGQLIDINCLEYATILINYAASIHYWCTLNQRTHLNIEYPSVLLWADNIAAETWAIKGCKRSRAGRCLGRLQCALMLNNPVGITASHVTTDANVIADRISRHKHETDSLLLFSTLQQEYPLLRTCQRFHPSPELLSAIMDSLLSGNGINPLAVSAQLRNYPGKIATSGTAPL
jgi:hypothetical protein